MEALSDLSDNQIEAIGLSEEVETINFTSIENNKKIYDSSRDKSEDVFPDDINLATKNLQMN
jgi:hypothetical protein